MPLVSVVIPAYNAARWISETLDSVLAQDYPDSEVIVVDDGSTDGTSAVVAGYPSVRCIRKPNGGQASARNVGIRNASGQYVAFVDADDLWLPAKLRLQMALLDRTGLAWAYSDAFSLDDATGRVLYTFGNLRRMYGGDVLKPLLFGDFIPSPTPVIRRSVFEAAGFFDESEIMRNREDWEMWLRIAARYPVGLVDQPLAYYRSHPTSSTTLEPSAIAFKSQCDVIDRAVAREPERLGPLRNQAIANVNIRIGCTLARNGDLAMARNLFERAIRLAPGTPKAYAYWLGCLIGGGPLRLAMRVRRQLQGRRDANRTT